MHFVAATPWHLSPTQDHLIHSAFCCCNLLVCTQIESYCLHTQFYYQCWITQVSDVGCFICWCVGCAVLHCNFPFVQLPEHLCLVQLQHWLLTHCTCQHTFYNHCYITNNSKSLLHINNYCYFYNTVAYITVLDTKSCYYTVRYLIQNWSYSVYGAGLHHTTAIELSVAN